MLKRFETLIETLFSSKIPNEDPFVEAQSIFFFSVIKLLYLYILILFIGTIFLFVQKILSILVLFAFFVSVLISHNYASIGKLKTASHIITWSHFLLIGIVLFFTGGNRPEFFIWLLLAPILAGVLLSKAYSYFFGGLLIALYTTVQLLPFYNIKIIAIFPAPLGPRLAIMAVITFFVVLLINEAANALKKALKKGTEEIAIRKQAELKAQESALLKENILNNMSHEFRTPLTGILGISEILSDNENPDFQKLGYELKISGKRLLNTLDQLLQTADIFSFIEAKEVSTFNVIALMREIINSKKEKAELSENQLILLSAEKALLVHSHKEAITEIVSQLLDNALKFTQNGTIKIKVVPNYSEKNIAISVIDNGIGIAESHIKFIFEEFKQVSSGMGRCYEGVGLGLAIVQRLVKKLNGDIFVESELGKGSEFKVVLSLV